MTRAHQLVFQRGLEKAVRRTGAWLITGGANSGVMELVGAAAKAASATAGLVCLGVGCWGGTLMHERLAERGCGQVSDYPWREVPARPKGVPRHRRAKAWQSFPSPVVAVGTRAPPMPYALARLVRARSCVTSFRSGASALQLLALLLLAAFTAAAERPPAQR